MLRLVLSIPVYLAYHLVVFPVLNLLGWVLIPIAAACKAYYSTFDAVKEAKGENPVVYHFTWGFMHLWDNYEDGIANDMYYKAPNMFLQVVYWSCLRNPTNNARITPPFRCMIEPNKVRFIGTFGDYDGTNMISEDVYNYDTKVPHWFFAWQGFHSNLFIHFMPGEQLYRFWIGTAKIYPTDIYGVTPYRQKGAGPVVQFKRVK